MSKKKFLVEVNVTSLVRVEVTAENIPDAYQKAGSLDYSKIIKAPKNVEQLDASMESINGVFEN